MHGMGDPKQLAEIRTKIAGETGVQVAFSNADLKQPAAIRGMVQSVADTFGNKLDILVNNAGIQFVSPVADFPEDKWDDIIAVCLSSAFHASKAALPYMKEAGWGRIINTGSMHALVASPYKSAYNAGGGGLGLVAVTLYGCPV